MTANLEVIRPKKQLKKPVKPQHPPIPLRMMQFAFGTLGRVFPESFAKLAFHFFGKPRSRAKHKVTNRVIERATISDMLVGKNMLKIYEWGKGTKTILLVHGWESRGTAFRSFVQPLVDAGYKVVAFDGPAHGNSSGKRADIKIFSGAIVALYHKYENVEGLICHSFGGATTAYAMGKLDPEIKLKRMVMIGVPASISYPIENALQTMNAPPSVRKHFIEKIEAVADMKIEDLSFEKIHPILKIEKTLVVHDRQDEQVSIEEGEKIVEHWSNAELQVTDGFGHFRLMKDEQVIERVVEFLVN